MATISLRAYIREIESLIDHNHTESAIAHCMHILQFMPKHIGTYRMLGKAMHETQRYTDAADVFQRVLSVVPDDFVSNVGLSIIRQDEGNLDSAIWHMERAYETQPANQPIQEELRRLYGRRDGLEPPRVRLTRSALARMYMKGHLYTQAIGELRAALAEDPQRADLQVLLAQAYYLTGQKVDAVEVCSQLLKKFPFCLEANRLLAIILPNTERAKDSEIYRQRVISLDPYLQKADPATLVADSISDAAITVDKLEILLEQTSGEKSQPEWASSLGEPFQISEEQERPDWFPDDGLSGDAKQGVAESRMSQPSKSSNIAWETSTGELGTDWLKQYEEATEQQEPTIFTTEPAIPEWMKAAGWEPSKGEEAPPLSWEEFEAENGGQIEQGEVPDWLKAIAPDSQAEGASTWLQEKIPGASDTIVNWLNETQSAAPEEDLTDLESVLDQAIAQRETAETENLEEVPDWLRGLEKQGPSNGPTTGELHIPDWMRETEPDQPAISEQPDSGREWLKEIGAEPQLEPTDQPVAEPKAKEVVYEIPAWLKPLEPEETEEPVEDLTSSQTLISSPQVSELQQEITPEKLANKLESQGAELESPDWLKSELIAEQIEPLPAEETLIEQPKVLEGSTIETSTEEIPDWLKPMMNESESVTSAEALGEETIIIPPPVEEAILTEQTTDEDITVIEESKLVDEALEPVAEKEVSLPDIGAAEAGLMDEDDALAFLSSLAAKHDGDAGWLESVVQGTMGEDASAMGVAKAVAPDQPLVEEVAKPELSETTAETKPDEEMPDWFQTIVDEAQAEQGNETIIAKPTTGTEQAPVEVVGNIEPPAPDIAAADAGLMDEDDALAFLASLAAKHEGDNRWLDTVIEQTMGEDASVLEKQPIENRPLSSEDTLFANEPFVKGIEKPIALNGEAEAIAWLEAISKKEKTEEAEAASTEPERAPESLEAASLEVTEFIADQDAGQEPADKDEIPEWLKVLGEEEPDEAQRAFLTGLETITKVDPNTASLSELEDIPGVGFIMAQNILNYRQSHGPIQRLEDLAKVPGISDADIRGLQEFIEIPEQKLQPSMVTRPLTEPSTEVDQVLFDARRYIVEQNYIDATNSYSALIKQGQYLPVIIKDLRDFLNQNPQNIHLWQALGDACLRNDQLQEAFEAYSHAEELLR